MEFVTSEGYRSNSKIVHCNTGYFYKIKCTRTNSQSLQCIQTDCSATGLITGNLLYEKRPHPHGPDMNYLELVNLKQRILKRCVVECTPHREIFDEEMSRARGLEYRLEFSSFLRTMERTRAAAQPKIPNDLAEYAGNLVDPRYSHLFKTVNGRDMFRGFAMGGPDAGSAVVFISPSLENLFTSAQELHVDATFKSRPLVPVTEQLLIIMAMYMDQAFPVAYALMTRKTEMAYRSVLDLIKTCIPEIVARNIVSDYEVGLSNALANIFPGARLQKCWFHMAQALEKNAKDFGMRREVYRNDDALHTMFLMSKALALLPANRIIEGFEEVIRESRLSPNVEVAERYISYFRHQWMERVGPENFSVYGMPRRTNNDQEIFHRHLNSIMNHPRPGIWHFTRTLLKVEHEYGSRYNRMQHRPILRARRRTYIQLDRKINSASERLTQGRISVREFLLYTGHLAYNTERRNGNRYNAIVPAQIVETIEGQAPNHQAEEIPTANVGEDIVGGIRRHQVQIQNLMEQQQINANQFPIQDIDDFIIPEDNDPLFHAIREIEQRRITRELEDMPNIPIDNTIALPRQINCCDICLGNEKTHACLPCGHKCLCLDCVNQISNLCPICTGVITSIVRIYD